MRVALCFSGLPRFINKTAQNIQECLMQDYDVDVFAHTWYREGDLMRDDGSSEWSSLRYTQNPTDLIEKIYHPLDLCVEEPIDFYSNSILHQYNFKPTLEAYMPHFLTEKGLVYYINLVHSMWYSIYRSNKLKCDYELLHGFTYDVVVRCRFDALYAKPVKYDQYNLTAINVSHNAGDLEHPQIRDWFAFSNSKNMDIYADLINNLQILNDMVSDTDRANEMFLHQHISNNNLQHVCNNFILDFIRN